MRPRLLGLPSSLCLRIPQRYRSTRAYNYSLDHLGQLFLEDTKIRNFTSCYKDPAFLDFLYTRTRLNDSVEDEEARLKREEGYEFVSPCGREVNYLAPDDSVLVFQKLIPEGESHWSAVEVGADHPQVSRSPAASFTPSIRPLSASIPPRGTSTILHHPNPPSGASPTQPVPRHTVPTPSSGPRSSWTPLRAAWSWMMREGGATSGEGRGGRSGCWRRGRCGGVGREGDAVWIERTLCWEMDAGALLGWAPLLLARAPHLSARSDSARFIRRSRIAALSHQPPALLLIDA